VTLPNASAALGDITEYTIPSVASLPQGIARGSDGAFWFAERTANAIGRVAADGTITELPLPTAAAQPFWITSGPDGNLWFTERSASQIGRVTPAGAITEFAVPTAASQPAGIAAGPDGALWFAEQAAGKIGRLTVDGSFTEYAIPSAPSGPYGITAGPDGAMWFTEQTGNRIGRITMDGEISEVAVQPTGRLLQGITAGPDGNLWFTERSGQAIASITPDMATITTFPLPASGNPIGITLGPDGALWFTENGGNKIGRISTDGTFTEYTLPNAASQPFGIAAGPDGVWFTEQAGNRVGRLSIVTDDAPPVIDLTTPADGAWYVLGDAPVAKYACSDEGGSGLVSCAGTVPSGAKLDATVGPHSFSVSAADGAGNQASVTHGYVVFLGVQGPLADPVLQQAGSSLPVTLAYGPGAVAKRTKVPRSFGALGASTRITQPVSCDDPSIALGEPQAADLNAHFTGTGREHIVWKTDAAWAGTCRNLVLTFDVVGWETARAVFVVRFA
jgi:streptogramin lyase